MIKPFADLPIHSDLGLKITGLDISKPLEPDTIQQLKRALLDYQLIYIPFERPLNPKEQIAFTRQLGEIEKFPYITAQYKAFPELCRVVNQVGVANANAGQYWHADGSMFSRPTHLSIYNIQYLPKEGTSTLFTNLYQALATLSYEKRIELEDLEGVHIGYQNHPVIWLHPLTQQPVLHVSEGFTHGFIKTSTGAALSAYQSKEITEYLHQHLWEEHTFYEHRWQVGDLIIADNFSVAHHAERFQGTASKILHRTATRGPSVHH